MSMATASILSSWLGVQVAQNASRLSDRAIVVQEEHPLALQVSDDRQIAVALGDRFLIDPELRDRFGGPTRQSTLDRPALDAPGLIPRDPE